MSKRLAFSFWLWAFGIFVYSYGFLDFNLTLSAHPLFLRFVAPLQDLVYFDRPHSAQLYVILFAALAVVYGMTLRQAKQYKLAILPWKKLLAITGLLTLAYPMLSYDLFNYMFHGKILWFYHMNPHVHAPLEFEGDLWLRFMRWVHTPSAYGPVFTIVESPAYLLGLGKFVPVLYLMKVTMAGFFLWCLHLVGKIGHELRYARQEVVFSQLMLALNPFLLFELVINGHNDAVMIAFFLLALLLSLKQQKLRSWVALALSIGVKYITALTIPAFLIKNNRLKIFAATLLLLLPVLLSPGRFQPWYLTWSLIPAVLINTSWSRLWIILTSLAGLIYYIPYIYSGFWNNSLPFVSLILYLPILLTGTYCLISRTHVRDWFSV